MNNNKVGEPLVANESFLNNPPNGPLCRVPNINKSLSSVEILSDLKGPPSALSTIFTSQPLKCDVSDGLTE